METQSGTDFISKDKHDPRISKGQASYGSTVVSASNLLSKDLFSKTCDIFSVKFLLWCLHLPPLMQDQGNDYQTNEQLLPPMDNVMRSPYHNLTQDNESLRFNNQISGGSQGTLQQTRRYGIISRTFSPASVL